MKTPMQNSLSALVAVLIWLSVLLLAVLVNMDDKFTYLEDNTDIQNHPAYPARVEADTQFPDMALIEMNVSVPMQDGTNLSANIYRPKSDGKYPVIMALTAYDKNLGPKFYPKHLRSALLPDFDHGVFEVSQWTTWEGPDPTFGHLRARCDCVPP